MDPKFADYRAEILGGLEGAGYRAQLKLLDAAAFGVPQTLQRAIIVALHSDVKAEFTFPEESIERRAVGPVLLELMSASGWKGARELAAAASAPAPTLVGGSKKHGGPDLGPMRARTAWAQLGVDGRGVADEAHAPDFAGMPRLTCWMMARLQGFPDSWDFGRGKTKACRQCSAAAPCRSGRAENH